MIPDNFNQSDGKTTTIRYSNILNLGDPNKIWTASIMSGAEYKNIFYEEKVTGSNPYAFTSGDPRILIWAFSRKLIHLIKISI